MLSFIKNFLWPSHQQSQPPQVASTSSLESVAETESNRKRKPSGSEPHIDIKKHRSSEGPGRLAGWNLDLEQADYKFSQETLSIFKGGGATVLVSRQTTAAAATAGGFRLSNRLFGCSGGSVAPSLGSNSAGFSGHHRAASIFGGGGSGVLRQLSNLPLVEWSPPPPPPTLPASTEVATVVVHSTPLIGAGGMQKKAGSEARTAAANAAPSTVAKRRAAAASDATRHDGDDDDCVITSVEAAPKSVAEIFSPCKYLSPDWLADVKTSSQSLKTYMQKVESEETLKMQYWAKRRAADEQDLVARVTRNLKLAERELPVVPYKYEEPPPTPPPSPPEEEPPEFPELSEAQLGMVERAWSRQLPGSEVLSEGFSLRVTREELRSFSGLNWLNDNVVNFFMQLVASRTGPGLPKVHAYSTFFYTKLSTSGYASVRRWTKKVDIFDRDVLLCPVHLHNNHWTLCIVDLRSRHILYLDSLSRGGGCGSDPSCLPLLRQYLVEEHRDKKASELPGGAADFRLVREIGAPQQDNGSDCGVFCCKFADYYCRGREFTFGQANMPYFRKRTTLEILEKRLLW